MVDRRPRSLQPVSGSSGGLALGGPGTVMVAPVSAVMRRLAWGRPSLHHSCQAQIQVRGLAW
jgi:hypothetical protein